MKNYKAFSAPRYANAAKRNEEIAKHRSKPRGQSLRRRAKALGGLKPGTSSYPNKTSAGASSSSGSSKKVTTPEIKEMLKNKSSGNYSTKKPGFGKDNRAQTGPVKTKLSPSVGGTRRANSAVNTRKRTVKPRKRGRG